MLISDETLASYMDGDLPADEAGRVETALAASPDLMRGLLAMLRADKAAGAYFHAIDGRPLPAGVITALEQFPTSGSDKDAPGNVVPLAGRPAPAAMPRRAAWQLPLAASIALAIGLGGGLGAGLKLGGAPSGDIRNNNALIGAGQPLYDVLEQGASGLTVALEGTAPSFATPLVTVAADGAYCREFEVAGPQVIIRGAACRQDDSNWLIAVQVAEPTTNAGGNYQTASEKRPTAITAFLAGRPSVDATEEKALITNNWTAN